jgi:isopropylmalate/homocitrate/citramalate synthase
MAYNVKTVIRMFKDEDGNYCADVSKDRTGVHNNEIIEDLSLLDWQSVIDKNKDKASFIVKNALNQAVETETEIHKQEIEKTIEKTVGTTESNSETSSSNSDLVSQINSKMKSFSVTDKAKAKKALEEKGLPATPKSIKAETNIDTLKSVLEAINNL